VIPWAAILGDQPRRRKVKARAHACPSRTPGAQNWSLGAEVASDTPLAFDLVYFVGNHKYTDDNQGTWYVVSR
jgi:hypothetical protein